MHKYNNQDHSMATPVVARNIATCSGLDPWTVNTDPEYHEEARETGLERSGRQTRRRLEIAS